MKKILTTTTLLLAICGTTAVLAGPIEDRQALMKGMAAASKDANTAAKATPFDAAGAKAAMEKLVDSSSKLPSLFPVGSDKGAKTGAAPAIWTDMAGFKVASVKLSTDAKAAGAATDAVAFAAGFKMVQADCGGCHKTYRISTN